MQPLPKTNLSNNKKIHLTQEHHTRLYQLLNDLDDDQLRLILTSYLQNSISPSTIQHYTRQQLFQQCLLFVETYYSAELEQALYAMRQKRFSSEYYQQQQQQQQPYYYAQQTLQYNVQPNYHFSSSSATTSQQLRPMRPSSNSTQSSSIINPRPQQQHPPQPSPYVASIFPRQQQIRHSSPPAITVLNKSPSTIIQQYQVPLLPPPSNVSKTTTPSSSSSSLSSRVTAILPSPNNLSRLSTKKIIHKTLPFYHPITCIYERHQVFHYDSYRNQYFSHDEFILSFDVCNQLALSCDYDPELDLHKTTKCLLLRLVRMDQSVPSNGKYDDSLPPNLVVHVNGHNLTNLPTPKACTRQQTDLIRIGREIDITSYCMFNPILKNELMISWSYRQDNTNAHLQYANAQYALHIFLCEHLTVDELAEKIIKKSVKFYRDDLAKLLAKARASDHDLGLEVSDQKLKLICSIDQRRLKIPVRATTCQHLQCFDLTNYIALNEKSGKWTCPVCNKSALFDDLQIDAYTDSILNSIQNENISEITMNSDLQWGPVVQSNINDDQIDSKLHIQLIPSSSDVIFIDDED